MIRDQFLGLSLIAVCILRIENVIITLTKRRYQRANTMWVNLRWDRRLNDGALICAIIVPPIDRGVKWVLQVDDWIVIENRSWPAFYVSVAHSYPGLAPAVMGFRHDLMFLFAEQPRLSEISYVYDDWMAPNIVLPVGAETFW